VSKLFARVKYSGQLDHGPRTCNWTAVCVVTGGPSDPDHLSGNEASARLLEAECGFRIEVFSEDLMRRLGTYGEGEADPLPEAERKYWETYVEGICRARIARGEGFEDLTWESKE
jgi:hypothetical protein